VSEANVIKITVPIPQRDPNKRKSHWSQQQKIAAADRGVGKIACIDAINRSGLKPGQLNWERARIDVRWIHPTKRFRDTQNIIDALKHVVDGFQDAGLIRDDSGISFGPVEKATDKNDPRVELVVVRT